MPSELYDLQLVSFGSNNEDIVLMRAFSGTQNGYFVDVGAAHPIMGNLVKNLSEHLGWRGVHVEPSENFAASLRVAYPSDHVAETVISNEQHDIEFFDIDDGWLSTADAGIAARHAAAGKAVSVRQAHATTLDKVLEIANSPQTIDLLKIDVEGTEPDVLAGLSFGRWSPRVILIEATEPMMRRRAANNLSDFLACHGYQRTLFDGANDFYVRSGEDCEFVEDLSIQANIFDRFIPAIWYEKIDQSRRPKIHFTPRSLTLSLE